MIASELLAKVFELSEVERAELAHQLLLSLEFQDFDADSESLWNAEAAVRAAAFDRGEVMASDWREAMARMRANLRTRKKA